MKIKKATEINLPDIVGKGYATFWNFKGRYRVVKGSRASKKSKTTALWFITNIMAYPDANLLVIRKTERTLRTSCFMDLKWAVHRLRADAFWEFKTSPLEAVYKPTGQKIYFRGLDNPLKITSISVDKGCLCWLWIEEAYEILKEDAFDTLDESIRGEVPEGLFKQITLTFNPWNEKHWMNQRFFKEHVGDDAEGKPIYKERKTPISKDGDILAITTNYLCNEWLDEADKRVFERMRIQNPRRYEVAALGNWGISEGLIYEHWKEEAFDIEKVKKIPGVVSCFGMDFGYTNDPSTLFCGLYDKENKRLYVFDEMYEKGMSNRRIFERVSEMGYAKEKIIADSAEPKSIDELKGYGLRIKGAKKGKDSVKFGIQWIQDLEIIIHPRNVNFITEISNYTWDKDRFGNTLNAPIDDFNHLLDAMRYALEKYIASKDWIN